METDISHKKMVFVVMILSQILLFFSAEYLSAASKASKVSSITDIQLHRNNATVKVVIKGNGQMKPKVYSWSNLIVIDIPDVKFNAKVPVKVVPPVKKVKVGKHKEKTRLVFYLEEMKKFDVLSRQNTIIIALKNTPPALKNASSRITGGQKETSREQKKSERIEKRKIKPVEIKSSKNVVKESKGFDTRLGDANIGKEVSTGSIAIKNTTPHIPVEEQEALREQPKTEIIRKEGIEPVNADTSVAAAPVKESKGVEIKKEESDTSKEILTDSSGKEYIIGPEDVLDIQVWGNDDLKRTVEVSQEGAFTFPLIDKVYAKGLTVFELEQLMKKRLANGYLKDPQVTITVSKYINQKVFVLGEVKKPGSYVIKGETHVLEIISDAGGLTDIASRVITIVRPGLSRTKEATTLMLDLDEITEGDPSEKFFVINGDRVYVNQAPPIYVTGEVNKPGEFRLDERLTVHQAIARAGGPTKKGALNRVKIIRMENGREKEFKPSLSDVIMPHDIIKVPESYF